MNAAPATKTKYWVVLWDNGKGTQRSNHVNDRSAKQKCKDMSEKFNISQFAEIVDDHVTRKITYNKGKVESDVVGTGEYVSPPHEDPVEKAMQIDGKAEAQPKRLKKVVTKAAIDEEAKVDPKKAEAIKATKQKAKVATADKKRNPVTKEEIVDASKRKKVGSSTDQFVEEFEPREGTLRKKLIELLAKNIDKPVSVVDIQEELYGEYKDQFNPALKMVIKGMRVMIENNSLPFDVETIKVGGELSYALKRK